MRRSSPALAAAVVAVITLVTFLPVREFEFVNYDDFEFVVENPYVATGFTKANVRQAFVNPYWATGGPVTWLSHMLDVEMFGLDAGRHHLVNLVLHVVSATLLLGVLWRTTGSLGRSTFVSALFALHPLHVESVAWVSQRKDVLSTLFWFLTMSAYVSYVQRRILRRYAIVVVVLALGLMAKPMVATLPFVLLLFDVWPLRRVRMDHQVGTQLRRLFVEKLPLIALSVIAMALTLRSQQTLGAVSEPQLLPITLRLSNAAVSYGAYLAKTLWPVELAPYYPYRLFIPGLLVAASALFVVGTTALSVMLCRRTPYFTVGWLWYVGTLVPVIGLVQVGGHAMADRFTYVPLVGIFIALTWAVAEIPIRLGWRRPLGLLVSTAVVFATAAAARAQVAHWKDGVTLWEHATRITPESGRAHANLGVALARAGRTDEAIRHYEEALRLEPSAEAHNNLALALTRLGRSDEALRHAFAAVAMKPEYVNARSNLATLLAGSGRIDEAAEHYAYLVERNPTFVTARVGLSLARHDQERRDEALTHILEAIRLDPGEARWHYIAGTIYLEQNAVADARIHFEAAIRLQPSHEGAKQALRQLDRMQ